MPHTTPIQPHWAKDYQTACDWAKTVLLHGSGPRAVVFDVDDTLITSNGGDPIKEVLELVKWCRERTAELDLKCVIVTAREQISGWNTHLEKALTGKIAGEWDVYLRKEGSADGWKSVMSFKYNARRDVETKPDKRRVVLTVGDRWWDVAHPNDGSEGYDNIERHMMTKYKTNPQTYFGKRPNGGEAFVKLGLREAADAR